MLESESGRWETLAMLARCHGFAPTSPCFRASKPQENSLNLRCHFMSSFEAMVKYGKMVGSKSSTNVQSWDAPEVEAVEGGRPASSAILELAQFFSFNQRQQDHPNAPAARPSATFVDNSSEPRKRRRQSSIKNRGPSHQVEHSSCKCNLRTPNVWWKRKFPKKTLKQTFGNEVQQSSHSSYSVPRQNGQWTLVVIALQLSETCESLHIFFRAAVLQAVLALQWRPHYGVNVRSLWTTFTILKDPCRLCFDVSTLASLRCCTCIKASEFGKLQTGGGIKRQAPN